MKTYVVRLVDGTEVIVEAESVDFSGYGGNHWEFQTKNFGTVAYFFAEQIAGFWEASSERARPTPEIMQDIG